MPREGASVVPIERQSSGAKSKVGAEPEAAETGKKGAGFLDGVRWRLVNLLDEVASREDMDCSQIPPSMRRTATGRERNNNRPE
jgi:hypothetical protein